MRSGAVARIPRFLHPGAWWLWAGGMAVAASQTTDPLLLLLILAATGLVVSARKPDAPWSRSFAFFLKLAVFVVAIRLVFQVILGQPIGTTVLITLPQATLPDWLAAVRLGGEITLESIVFAACQGLRLAVLLACFGAANSLASPARLLKSIPSALYEIGVAVVVAMTFAPQLVTDLERVRLARRLRGRPVRGIAGLVGAAGPVLDGALDRAVNLAAAMDCRGYGRSAHIPRKAKHATDALVLGGLLGLCIGIFGVLQSGASPIAVLVPLTLGGAAAVVGLWLAGRRAVRTRYRPDPWRIPETAVAICGVAAAGLMFVGGTRNPVALEVAVTPLMWPELPLIPLLGIVIGMSPAVIAPPIPVPQPPSPAPAARPEPAAVPAR